MVYAKTSNTTSSILNFHGNSLLSILVLVLCIYMLKTSLKRAKDRNHSPVISYFPGWLSSHSVPERMFISKMSVVLSGSRIFHLHLWCNELTSWWECGSSFHWKTARGVPVSLSSTSAVTPQVIISLASELCLEKPIATDSAHTVQPLLLFLVLWYEV